VAKIPIHRWVQFNDSMAIAVAASALNRQSATGAHERVEIEVQARKLI
jgi:hypothetical protein